MDVSRYQNANPPRRSPRVSVFLVALGAVGCGSKPPVETAPVGVSVGPTPPPAPDAVVRAGSPVTHGPLRTDPTAPPGKPGAADAKVVLPEGRVDLARARRTMLELINRDRATQGLPPVALDEGPAQAAAQRHAEDMAKHGFLGHWGTDGSVPEQRYTEAGGVHLVMENALCFFDEKPRTLDPRATFDTNELARAEDAFFGEKPPMDGHRQNILKRPHTHVGIGLAQPIATATEIPIPCLVQEFVDAYGEYTPLPKSAKPGQSIHVEGKLTGGAKPTGVGVAKVVLPQPLPVSEANRRRSYPIPQPYDVYWPAGFVSKIPLKVNDASFAIDIPIPNDKGLYEISVFTKYPGAKSHAQVGLRTLRVE